MKDLDIESQLHDARVEPRRPLHRDFTKQTIGRIDMSYYDTHSSRLSNVWRFFTMKLSTFTRPVAVAGIIVGLTAVGGTAYAIARGWPQAQSSFVGESSLQNGNKLYTIASNDCISTTTADISKLTDWTSIKPTERLTKFEVETGVNVDTKDLEQVALATCNEGASRKQKEVILDMITPGVRATPSEFKRHYNDTRLTVTSIDESSISGQVWGSSYDELSKRTEIVTHNRTYRLGTDAKVFDYDSPTSLTGLKKGDTVELVLYSEDMPGYMNGIQSTSKEIRAKSQSGDQGGVLVKGIVKIPPFTSYMQAVQNLYNKYGNDVRIESIKVE